MRSILSQELTQLVKELQWMKGFHIAKFYESKADVFRLRLTKKGESADLRIILCKTVNKTVYIDETGPATGFAASFRNVLDNAAILGISQLNHDRIIEIDVAKGGTAFKIILEMFGKGNLLVTDSTDKIVIVYKRHKFADRDVIPGAIYTPPKNENMTEHILLEAMPVIYRNENGMIVDYSIGKTPQKYEGLAKEKSGSLEELLDRVYYEDEKVESTPEDLERKKREQEITHSIEKQEKMINGAEKDIEANRLAGQAIFSNMTVINKMIEEARQKKHITVEELAAIFPSLKIKNIDLKDKTITIVLE
jgi:predicted ribosome quality control (RQC) complex YloA/Tae2 family protein